METFNKPRPEFAIPPAGLQIMGLQAIKNIVIKGGKNSKTGETWPAKPGFRFVFRHKTIDNCFLNHEERAYYGEQSGLFQLVSNMSGGHLKGKVYAEEMVTWLETLKGRWFQVMVSNEVWPAKTVNGRSYPESVHARVLNRTILPVGEAAQDWPTCHDYFKALGGPEAPPVNDNLMDQFGPGAAERALKGIAGKPKPQSEPISEPDLFKGLPDEKVIKTMRHQYDLTNCLRLSDAQKLCLDSPGVALDPAKTKWRTTTEIKQLYKYYKGLFTEDIFDGDELPFE